MNLENNCMFASHKYFEETQNIHFNDKELPMGNYSERLVLLLSEYLCNPKGNSAYNLFSMHKKRNCNAATIQMAVTPAQQSLLELCSHLEAEDLASSINSIFELGTFHLSPDVVPDLDSSLRSYHLMQAIQEIAQEVQVDHVYVNPKNQ
jgi:hypothetical protein